MSGMIVILPPTSFTIVASAAPQLPSTSYNELPCTSWPEADRLAGRWICPIADTAPFKETTYGVRLKVQNPSSPGAARSWRVELWEEEASKPVAATRGIQGMEVSGPMQAALSQENQLLGSINTVRFDITPQQPIGNVPNTRLRVLAPPGFVVIKRCLGFQRIELPVCECIGSDSNSFELVFSEPGAIQGGTQYSFQLQLQNPVNNIADADNVWSFDTLRPDGVARDTARSQGFFLYPYEFSSFVVVPLMRKPGPQTIVIRFISPLLIPFDDYIRVRAPQGVTWYTADLQFSTQGELTQANQLGAKEPSVEYETPNELVVQLTTTAQANFEYGIAARANIPQATPVPNAWWIEQYRRTGNPAPDSWRYIASKGATGFKTQVLINTQVVPFNMVQEAWQNPTLFVFETTIEVMPFLQATASGTELVPAVLLVEGPPEFTYICPLTDTVYMPQYSIALPADTTCDVDHNVAAERNKLYLTIPTGLKGDTRYTFTVDVVNAQLVDPLRNFFRLATMLNGEVGAAKCPVRWKAACCGVFGCILAQEHDGSRQPSGLMAAVSRAQVLAFFLLRLTCVNGATCSSLQAYVDWVGQWKTTCQPANPVPSANFSWFSSCSWIDCECLWGALAAPVATDELAPCFEEALLKSLLDQDVKWFVTSLLRTCRVYTDQLSQPCGQCDKYKDVSVVEEATAPGFELASRMDNTRYILDVDRRVEATANIVTFVIGTTMAVSTASVLEIRAPIGFRFMDACDGQVGWATWVPLMLTFPSFGLCQGMGAADASMANIARLQVTGSWQLGDYGLFVTVMNPMFTPARNFWGFTIYDPNMLPLMSESWVYGFDIQVVLDPKLTAYNQGNGVDGEAAINHIDISFRLSTRMPPMPSAAHAIVVTAPQGFFFPSICQSFTLDTFTTGYEGFPKGTGCQGNNGNVLKISLPFMRELRNGTNYMFRALVVNPRETFTDVDSPDKYWRIESQYADGTMVDLNRVIPSFPILSRLRYFAVNTLSQVGLAPTTYRIHFRTAESLPPQQTVHIYPPARTTFGGLTDGACINTDPVLLSLQFPTPLISGVTRLPEWVSCQVISPTELQLRNEEPILGGRPLIAGPVFEFFIMNATNAESTPLLNLFQIEAITLLGKEVWTAPGWVIYPELKLTAVSTANPGYGLYTNFTIMLQTVTEVPSGGSVRIIAPDDYYFGPLIETAATRYDPLVSEPSPQGAGQERPSPSKVTICHILRPDNWACSLEFEPCVIMNELDELITLGMVLSPSQENARVGNRTICLDLRAKCDTGGQLSDLVSCSSQGSTLDLFISPMVYLPARRLFQFLIQGYNARNPPVNESVNSWHFMTRNADSENTVLDEKPVVPGVSLIGIVLVDSLVPSNTKVSSIENYVTVTLRLTTQHAAQVTCVQDASNIWGMTSDHMSGCVSTTSVTTQEIKHFNDLSGLFPMPLATEEEEKFLEVQEWASSIFAAPGRARNLARKQADAAAALTRTCPDGASTWPSADQSTASLAMQLDSGPVRRRSTHGIRSSVRDALRWTDHGRMASVRLADSLANSAVALHTPTSAIRSLCSLARVNVGLWSAVRNGSLPKHVALTGTEGQLSAFGSSYEAYVKDEELAVWKDWLITEDAQVNVDIEDTFALLEDAEKSQMEMETTKVSKMNSLRAYQKSALEAVGNASPKNCCVVLPCGAGKTRLGAALTWNFLESHPAGCIIVLCLRREGIRQWKRELLQNWGIVAFEAGASQSGETLPSCQVILVTYHRMLCERRRALAEMSRLHEAGEEHVDEVAGSIAARLSSADEALLIADECHMVPAPKICELLASMLNHHSRRLVGLTATLLRESGVNKDDEDEGEVPWPLLGNCVFRETFANLAPEYLAPVQCIEVSVPVVGEWRKIFKRQQLAPAVCLSGGKWLVLERLLAKHANDSLLITVERCEQARQIATMFGIIPIDGTVPPAQMKDYLERFRQRKILALVATHVLDDSADFPELFVMIQMAGHFASRRQEQQRLGRLLRWGPVKRRRWEETSARPTFYVLVHKGTVEERMSRHRTRSVLGVSYENVDANSLMKSPESALGEGSAFFQRKRLCSSFRELDQQYETALGKTLR
eukprot:symbB.v1.2.005781.t4/scaffold289.1/size287290/26